MNCACTETTQRKKKKTDNNEFSLIGCPNTAEPHVPEVRTTKEAESKICTNLGLKQRQVKRSSRLEIGSGLTKKRKKHATSQWHSQECSVKSIHPNTENSMQYGYDENDNNNMSDETKCETNYSTIKWNDVNTHNYMQLTKYNKYTNDDVHTDACVVHMIR